MINFEPLTCTNCCSAWPVFCHRFAPFLKVIVLTNFRHSLSLSGVILLFSQCTLHLEEFKPCLFFFILKLENSNKFRKTHFGLQN